MADDGKKGAPLRFAAPAAAAEPVPRKSWNILVVDDDDEVRHVTRLLLRDKVILGRGLNLVDASSAAEARELMKSLDDLACVLLDVVMEENDSGLKLARYLREDLGNSSARIVLRTGQPGQAPENKVILEYAINDYREKTELTEQKLFTTVVTAIRSYRDIVTIEESRAGMKMIIDASSSLFTVRSMDLFAEGILRELMSLLYLSRDAVYGVASGLSASESGLGLRIFAGAGRYAGSADRPVEEVLDARQMAVLRRAHDGDGMAWEGGTLALVMRNREGRRGVIVIEGCPPIGEVETQLVSLFCANVAEAFSNISMHHALEASFRERESLVREVHHRVRNNLQMVAGLINMALHDGTVPPLQALRLTGARIESMARVHSCVFTGDRLETVDFSAFIEGYVDSVRNDYIEVGSDVPIHVKATEFVLPLTAAIPFGLVVNELLVSALACAVERGQGASIDLTLDRRPGDGWFRCRAEVRDVAPGGKSPFGLPGQVSSNLVRLLTEQIRGELSLDPAAGLWVELVFPGPQAAETAKA